MSEGKRSVRGLSPTPSVWIQYGVVYSIVLTQACVSYDRYCMVNVGVDRRPIGW